MALRLRALAFFASERFDLLDTQPGILERTPVLTKKEVSQTRQSQKLELHC